DLLLAVPPAKFLAAGQVGDLVPVLGGQPVVLGEDAHHGHGPGVLGLLVLGQGARRDARMICGDAALDAGAEARLLHDARARSPCDACRTLPHSPSPGRMRPVWRIGDPRTNFPQSCGEKIARTGIALLVFAWTLRSLGQTRCRRRHLREILTEVIRVTAPTHPIDPAVEVSSVPLCFLRSPAAVDGQTALRETAFLLPINEYAPAAARRRIGAAEGPASEGEAL